MNELERDLHALGQELDVPAEPDLAPAAVLAQLDRRPLPGGGVAVALAVLAVAVGAAFAVPQARTTILSFFHLARRHRRAGADAAARRRALAGRRLGRPLSRAEAERAVGFELAAAAAANPTRVYVRRRTRWRRGRCALTADPLLLSEYRAADFELPEEARGRRDSDRARPRQRRAGPLARGRAAHADLLQPPRRVPPAHDRDPRQRPPLERTGR